MTEIPQISEVLESSSEIKKWTWTHKKSPYRHQMCERLREYKLILIKHDSVIPTLMEHLADCLQATEKTQKHNEMTELLVVLFMQLLQVPEPHEKEGSKFAGLHLQRDLLMKFKQDAVLDAINYLSQEFETDLQKNLAMQILEIQYSIFRNFSPEQIYFDSQAVDAKKKHIYEKVDSDEQRRKFLRSTRLWKQGPALAMTRADGTQALVQNIYQQKVDTTQLGGKVQRLKPNVGKQSAVARVEQQHLLVDLACLEQADKDVLNVMREYLDDILENTYNALVNAVYSQVVRQLTDGINDRDNYHYFKLSTFMVEVVRHKAYEQQRRAEDAPAEPSPTDKAAALFKQPLKKQVVKSKAPLRI